MRKVLILSMLSLMACDNTASWECGAVGTYAIVASGTMSCADYRDKGDQLLEQERQACEADQGAQCECSFDASACGDGEAND